MKFNPQEILRTFSMEEQRELLQELLLQRATRDSGLADRLKMAESWLLAHAESAPSPSYAHARRRMWFIFMLLRYGALRTGEVLALKGEDFAPRQGLIHIHGKRGRMVPLPCDVGRKLAQSWDQWTGRLGHERPFFCDASQVRRVFGQCAAACGLLGCELTGNMLRRHRAFELQACGLHPVLVSDFLGLHTPYPLFGKEEAFTLIRAFVQKPPALQTSARNVFRGHIAQITTQGILVSLTLRTPQRLAVNAMITETSRKNLDLGLGKPVMALVKAPWVSVFPAGADAKMDNVYNGRIASIAQDDKATEILVNLADGTQICALYADRPGPGLAPGVCAQVGFMASSVILTGN